MQERLTWLESNGYIQDNVINHTRTTRIRINQLCYWSHGRHPGLRCIADSLKLLFK